MTFRPVLPLSGLTGWNLLNRTIDAQKSAQANSPVLSREITYFRDNISKVSTAEDLVSDRTLLKVALGAFGLQDDLPNRFFIRKVLEEGVFRPDSLANKLSDPRYAALSKSFGFGDLGVPNTRLSTFPDQILNAYKDQSFEVAVGEINPDMRLALGLKRELENVLGSASSPNAHWFGVMGSPPLRAVFETALNLPASFAALDIDQQLSAFRDKADLVFGVSEVRQFAGDDMLQQLRDRFLLLADIKRPQSLVASSPVLGLFSGGGSSAGILSTLYGQ
jgi:hypothetical protein